MFWALYVGAWIFVLFYMQVSKRGAAGIRGTVALDMTSTQNYVALSIMDFLIVIGAFSLLAAPFFIFEPWWTAFGVFFGTFVVTSIVTGSAIASMIRKVDMPALFVRWGALLGLATIAMVLAAWWSVAQEARWL